MNKLTRVDDFANAGLETQVEHLSTYVSSERAIAAYLNMPVEKVRAIKKKLGLGEGRTLGPIPQQDQLTVREIRKQDTYDRDFHYSVKSSSLDLKRKMEAAFDNYAAKHKITFEEARDRLMNPQVRR